MKAIGALIVVCLGLLCAASVSAFTAPERLEYNVQWLGIYAGTAVMSLEKSGANYLIKTEAKSADYVSLFYRVEDSAWSVVDGSQGVFGYPLNYHLKTREGRHRKDKEVVFDRKSKKALYTNHIDGKKEEFSVAGDMHDPLSGFFAVRNLVMNVGSTVKVRIFDSKKTWDVEVEVLRKEKVTVPAGTFDTVVVKPKLQSEGIFSRKGDMYIWLTDDEKKIPVVLKTKVAIGSVTAELTAGQF
ncbi:MAG: DUF3108 domain-containing protein [bacterium]